MNVKSIIIFILIASFLVLGCNYDLRTVEQGQVSDNYTMILVQDCDSDGNIEEWMDKETGVHYFIYSEKFMNAGFGGMIPRYNADGSLYVDQSKV